MTTLIALATKDALVLGCDSLGTSTKLLIDPVDLVDFFDSEKDFALRNDEEGNPILKSFGDVYGQAKPVPNTHMTHMAKLFPLAPLEMGLMSTGIASIEDRTIKSLIEEFQTKDSAFRTKPKPSNYTVKSIARKTLSFISKHYERRYSGEKKKPYLEFILGGYDKRGQIPQIVRLRLPENEIEDPLMKGKFGIVFGGETKEIQRLVFGTDHSNRLKLSERHLELLRKYRDKMNTFLKENGISTSIPDLSIDEIMEFGIFGNGWDLDGFDANWGDFSEQNAIECVDFFVNIMIKSQQFSVGMPTVGGEARIAMITKSKGFQFIPKEEYYHGGHFVPK